MPQADFQIRTFAGWNDLPDSSARLFEEAGRRNFFLTRDWFQLLSRTAMDEGQQLRIYHIGDAAAAGTAGMFVGRVSRPQGRFLPLRKLSAFTNYYSCFFALLLAGEGRQPIRALTAAIAAEKPRWDAVELQPLDVDSADFADTVAAFRDRGFVVQTYFSSGNWYLPVQGRSFEQYVKSLAPALRNTLRRKRKKLEESGRARIEIVTGGEQLDSAIETYTKVYLASWKRPEPYVEFMPGLIRLCAARQALRLGLLYVDGEAAAAQLWIVHHGRALIYKLAYDERFADLSVGTILTATLMQHVLDVDKVEEVDYLTGDDAYKKDWMSHRRERWGMLAMNRRTLRGAMCIARHVGSRRLKQAGQWLERHVRLPLWKGRADSSAGRPAQSAPRKPEVQPDIALQSVPLRDDQSIQRMKT